MAGPAGYQGSTGAAFARATGTVGNRVANGPGRAARENVIAKTISSLVEEMLLNFFPERES